MEGAAADGEADIVKVSELQCWQSWRLRIVYYCVLMYTRSASKENLLVQAGGRQGVQMSAFETEETLNRENGCLTEAGDSVL